MSSLVIDEQLDIPEPKAITAAEISKYTTSPYTIHWSRYNLTHDGVVNGFFEEDDLLAAIIWAQAKMVDGNYLGVKIVSQEGYIYCVKKDGRIIDYNGF